MGQRAGEALSFNISKPKCISILSLINVSTAKMLCKSHSRKIIGPIILFQKKASLSKVGIFEITKKKFYSFVNNDIF